MERCVLLLYLFLGFSFSGVSQSLLPNKQQDLLGKGHVTLGVNVGQGYRGNYPTTNSVTPRIQYFITDNWSVAAEGRYMKAKSANELNYVGAGVATRYYVIKTKRFTLFGHVSTAYGQSKYTTSTEADASQKELSTNNWQTNAGIGVNYRLGKRCFAEALMERSVLPSTALIPDYSRWQAGVGLHYRLK